MNDREMMEVARRLDCIITLGENTADEVYGTDAVPTGNADVIAGDAAIITYCARHIAASLSASVPGFADTFHRAKVAAMARAAMLQQKKGGAA